MTAYYNEYDAHAAGWLRNLVAAGHLPAGHVDDRSILDVEPGDLAPYDECHFFAGIGGWPLALQLAGWTGPVWTGSCPCQPLSSAGQRKGHADERHLWPAFYRLIAECRPATVVGEQVASKDGREWLAGVRADLEHLGYAVGAADLPAAGVGAPHIRQRLFWVADASGERRQQVGRGAPRDEGAHGRQDAERKDQHGYAGCDGATGGLGDAAGNGRGRRGQPQHAVDQGACGLQPDGSSAGGFWGGALWLPCLDGKARRVESSIQPLVDARGCICGLRLGQDCTCTEKPSRVGMLRGTGNAIVPQAAAAFVRAFMETSDAAN